jgi:aerobic-type carbon monoxide dehydrogenase small subunit (CoxS/CutS family)
VDRITELEVNGVRRAVDVDGATSLLTVLRDHLDLTGSKYGCGEGQCGACTVLINGFPRHSCTTQVRAARGKQITTIEGLAAQGKLHPVQQAFLDVGAMQCGYCTSGMIMTAVSLLKAHPNPSPAQIALFMQGNICRCGTYPRIEAAIRQAAGNMKGVER